MEKSYDKINRKFSSRMQARLLLVFCVITLLLVGLMGRLIYIMQADGDRYAKTVLSRQSYVSAVLPYKRGDIIDRNGTVLARSELQYRLILDPKRLLQNEDSISPTLAALKESFGIEAETIQTIMQEKPDSQYVTVVKNLKYDAVKSFKTMMEENNKKKENSEKKIMGVWFEEEYVRAYPYKSLACDVLGFTSTDNTGYWGIEEYYNEELNGTNGREYGYYDSDLNIERIVKKPVNGNTIISTIDANVQRMIQEHIIAFNTEFGSKNIGILVMNPNNGEIIAMASNQEYDLNSPRSLEGIYPKAELAGMTEEEKTAALNALWKNDVISSGFEPGSTFKPVTIASALEEDIVTENTTYICDGGEQIGSSYIKCSKVTGHGEITLGEALMVSCNDALMQIVAQEGKDIFYRYQKSFGFGKKTGIDLPGEEAGIIMSLDDLKSTELATSSFGQSFNTTMIQMAAAYSSLVNGGYYYEPHVVKQIVNDNGATIKNYDELLIRQTVSEKTSEFVQNYMYQTVETGTAQGAQVPGYAVGGKTGTAQKFPRAAKTYVVSFLGAVPAINPEVVVYVMIDEPQNVVKQADSSIATKLASRVMTEILPALGIYPEGDIDYLLPSKTDTNSNENANNSNNTNNNTASQNSNENQNSNNTEDQENTEDTQSTDNEEDLDQNKNQEEDSSTLNNEALNSDEEESQDTTENTENPDSQTDLNTLDNQNLTNGTENLGEDEFNADALD
jgi:stage V sporulation protein D (sporulation-specific penicillin-binding protein)